MTPILAFLLLQLFSLLWTPSRGDAEVSCVVMETCVLPCSFQGSADAVVHWTLSKNAETSVLSYDLDGERLAEQDQSFRGRTSVFPDEISSGNASLLLTGVAVRDEGRYKCLTDTIHGKEDSYVNLKVDAPVQDVEVQQVGEKITCRSEGIYPEPNLTWSTRPPSNVLLKSTTIVQRGVGLLYRVSSSLSPAHSDTDLAYVCSVSTRSSARTAELGSRIKTRKHPEVGPATKTENGIAIVQVVGVVLVAVAVGLVPCFYHKCKKLQGHIKSSCSGETKVV